MALGRIVDMIRQSFKQNKLDYCESDLKQLMEMGFIPDIYAEKDDRILLAFQLFVAKFGHGNVPTLFR